MNIVEKIFAEADVSAKALVYAGGAVTYGELREQVDDIAARLSAAIPSPECARIGFFWEDGPGYVACALAMLRVGACLVPIAPELAKPERARLAQTTALDFVLAEGECPKGIDGTYQAGISTAYGRGHLWAIVRHAEQVFPQQAYAALNPAFVRFSSGTTGDKKGVVLSHETLLERITAANEGLKLTPNDRVLWTLPMAHHFAVSVILYLWSGATTLLSSSHLGADLLSVACAGGATVFYGSPFHHALLAADKSSLCWDSLRLSVSTASPLSQTVANVFFARHGKPITQGLGIIEVGLPFLNLEAASAKPHSIGKPLPAYYATLRAEGANADEGELLIAGPGIADAYLSPWQPRNHFLENGWFATGDIVRRDHEGDAFILGRSRSVINVGGLKCFPEEIEAVLNLHPQVARSRVSGRPHPNFGALPVAEVVLTDPDNPPLHSDILAHCRERLSRYKLPVEIRYVERIQLTASGKVQRS